jgi:hypothetical protein
MVDVGVYSLCNYLANSRFPVRTLRVDNRIEVDCLNGGSVPQPGGKGVMKEARVKRLARLATGALLLLVGLGAPGSARADCSHPLGSQSNPFLDLYRLDAIFMAGASSDSHSRVSQSPLESPPRRSPCSGLSCSSRDPLPISTASQALESTQQWGAPLGALVELDTQAPAGQTFDEPAPTATGEKTSIFHPPRG